MDKERFPIAAQMIFKPVTQHPFKYLASSNTKSEIYNKKLDVSFSDFKIDINLSYLTVVQDLNTPVSYNQESRGNPAVTTSSSSVNIAVPQEAIHPALTQAVSCISTPITVSEQGR